MTHLTLAFYLLALLALFILLLDFMAELYARIMGWSASGAAQNAV
jgi:hypothetical protein